MNDYTNLIKVLRALSESQDEGWQYAVQQAMTEAADAIEKLSAKQVPMMVKEIHVDEYYCPACGAENNCDDGIVNDLYCPCCGQRLVTAQDEEADNV